MPEPFALGGAFDETGNVCDDELRARALRRGVPAAPDVYDAEMGLERGEGIVGDLRRGGRDPGDEGGLSGVRPPDEGDVGEQLQLEVEPALLAALALLGKGWGSQPVGEEAGVAPPAATSFGSDEPVAGDDEVGEEVAVERADHRPLRNGHHEVAAAPAVTPLARTVRAVARFAVRVVLEGEERDDLGRGLEKDVSARTAVTAVRAAL